MLLVALPIDAVEPTPYQRERRAKATEFDFDQVIDKMIAAASRFNVDRVKQEDVAKVGGAPPDES